MACRVHEYVVMNTLGVGTFGKVKLAEHTPTCQKVAIKIINKTKMHQMHMNEKLSREINILRQMQHPHVIRMYELIDSPTELLMVMEYVSNGELFDFIVHRVRLREPEARKMFQQIVAGVEFCHSHMVCHRDIKPENILLDQNFNVKIADFGLSNRMRDGEFLKTSCGSPNYASPEVVSGKYYAGPEVDVWSCGVVLYALLCGTLPFDDENVQNLFRKIKSGNFTLPGHISADAKELIAQMLLVDPIKRVTISQIKKNRWFKVNLPGYIRTCYKSTESQRLVHAVATGQRPAYEEAILADMRVRGILKSEGQPLDAAETVSYELLLDSKQVHLQPDQTGSGQRGSTGNAMSYSGPQSAVGASQSHMPNGPSQAGTGPSYTPNGSLVDPTAGIGSSYVLSEELMVQLAEANGVALPSELANNLSIETVALSRSSSASNRASVLGGYGSNIYGGGVAQPQQPGSARGSIPPGSNRQTPTAAVVGGAGFPANSGPPTTATGAPQGVSMTAGGSGGPHGTIQSATQAAAATAVAAFGRTGAKWKTGIDFNVPLAAIAREIPSVLCDLGFVWYAVTPWKLRVRSGAKGLGTNGMGSNTNGVGSSVSGVGSGTQGSTPGINFSVSQSSDGSATPPMLSPVGSVIAPQSPPDFALCLNVLRVQSGKYLVDLCVTSGSLVYGLDACMRIASALASNPRLPNMNVAVRPGPSPSVATAPLA